MPRGKQDIEFIVHYAPDMECQVQALLIVLGYGKAPPRADAGTVETAPPQANEDTASDNHASDRNGLTAAPSTPGEVGEDLP